MTVDPDRPPLEEPLAHLERILMASFVAGAGENLEQLLVREDPEARELLRRASQFAAERLTEVEARAHYVRALHGQP